MSAIYYTEMRVPDDVIYLSPVPLGPCDAVTHQVTYQPWEDSDLFSVPCPGCSVCRNVPAVFYSGVSNTGSIGSFYRSADSEALVDIKLRNFGDGSNNEFHTDDIPLITRRIWNHPPRCRIVDYMECDIPGQWWATIEYTVIN